MPEKPASHLTPFDLDVRDPDFPRHCARWAQQTRCEVLETVVRSMEKIASSRALLMKVDRIAPNIGRVHRAQPRAAQGLR